MEGLHSTEVDYSSKEAFYSVISMQINRFIQLTSGSVLDVHVFSTCESARVNDDIFYSKESNKRTKYL